jgi:hypothetical protein
LNGHCHPATDFVSSHFGRILEFTSTALWQSEGVNVLVVDNGRLSYGRISPNKTKNAMVISPTRNSLAAYVFPDQTFQIRVLSFSPEAKKFKISGAVVGQLQFQRKTESGASLYGLNVSLPPGHYDIKISGDLQDNFSFAVGKEIASMKEVRNGQKILREWEPLAFLALLHLLLIVFGLSYVPKCLEPAFERTYHFMSEHGSFSILGMFFAPLYIGYVLRKLWKPAQFCVYAIVLLPFVFPLNISRIETAINFQFIWGYVCQGHVRVDPVSSYFAYHYFQGIACGFVSIFTFMAFTSSTERVIEMATAILLISRSIIAWKKNGNEYVIKGPFLEISPGFHVIPIVMTIAVLCTFFLGRPRPQGTWQNTADLAPLP